MSKRQDTFNALAKTLAANPGFIRASDKPGPFDRNSVVHRIISGTVNRSVDRGAKKAISEAYRVYLDTTTE